MLASFPAPPPQTKESTATNGCQPLPPKIVTQRHDHATYNTRLRTRHQRSLYVRPINSTSCCTLRSSSICSASALTCKCRATGRVCKAKCCMRRCTNKPPLPPDKETTVPPPRDQQHPPSPAPEPATAQGRGVTPSPACAGAIGVTREGETKSLYTAATAAGRGAPPLPTQRRRGRGCSKGSKSHRQSSRQLKSPRSRSAPSTPRNKQAAEEERGLRDASNAADGGPNNPRA